MGIFTVIFIFLLSVVTSVYGFFKYSFGYWKSKGVPNDEPSIPYGSLKGLDKTFHIYDIMKKMYDKYKPTGVKFCGAYFFARPILVLLDLELIKQVLIKDFTQFDERGFYHNEEDDPLSANMLTLNSEKWKRLRLKLTPTFTSARIKFMFPTIVAIGERLRDSLFEMVQQNDELEILELCARFTTDVIGTCAFGIECNSLKDPNNEFRYYSHKVFSKPRHGYSIVTFMNDFGNIARTLHMKTYSDDVIAFFLKLVRETVEYREKNGIVRNDLMNLLIQLKNEGDTVEGKAITLNEITAQAYIFFAAGFETSSSLLTYCLYELAMNPDVQTKARQVIQEAYQKHNGQFTYEMMMDMPYIDQILEETLRIHPPVPLNARKAKNDYRLPGTDVVIERGTKVIIPVQAIQLDPEYYPNPDKFDPERFSSDEKKKRNIMTWLAFGDGPRNCIGLRFGLMQTRIGLVTFLNNFEILIGPKTTIPITNKLQTYLSIPNECYLKLKPVKCHKTE